MTQDLFEHKADIYESDENRVSNVDNIANAIIGCVSLNRTMHLMDFGSGTGLLLQRISPFVRKITAIDISESMNQQLEKKRSSLSCEIDILHIDLESNDIPDKFDGIISSMTMHHVSDIRAMFVKFYSMLNDGGIIAISDLDKEDGSFHTEDTGVYHFGFERIAIVNAAQQAGLKEVEIVDASAVHKPHGAFPVFLLTAKR
ncbi:class I SAM-dependent methyltransferase [Paraglaciecola sp. MB-3u-78]|jgi:cyclopropane fatty-acyl-phospholipid synthase-like methyltransferase|uniref:class I SAM-dependent DNA methyltransferase n=1 Tax=Paraglaciecola sp. MB-3u-78 TaxID=2058332 RepID=UPI000C33F8DC|nr:class I SAM-dependent methyltransferase [Paraglaciecola sp. MB-3u-78]PKG99232.1 class I SAM-dependent methyltransferase [Paraglaciecola sp. MB-3u-78]